MKDHPERRVDNAKMVLVKSSPVPIWLVTVITIMLAITLSQAVYHQLQRNAEQEAFQRETRQITSELDRQQGEADADRKELQKLLEKILKARTAAEAQSALDRYLREQREVEERRRRERESRERSRSASHGSGPTPRPSPQPTPTSTPRPPRPIPTSSPTRTPPAPSPLVTCTVVPIIGRVCA